MPLRLAPGVPTVSVLEFEDAVSGRASSSACSQSLEVANVGSTAIQVLSVGFHYTSAPEPNPTVYRLVEACSVLQLLVCRPPPCLGCGGGAEQCSVYYVQVKLLARPADSEFFGQLETQFQHDGKPGPVITLAPRSSVVLIVDAYCPDPMLYRAVAALDAITASGRQVVTFPQFVYSYAFADASAFTCYRLQGNNFVAWQRGAAAVDRGAMFRQKWWCL